MKAKNQDNMNIELNKVDTGKENDYDYDLENPLPPPAFPADNASEHTLNKGYKQEEKDNKNLGCKIQYLNEDFNQEEDCKKFQEINYNMDNQKISVCVNANVNETKEFSPNLEGTAEAGGEVKFEEEVKYEEEFPNKD